ncbi:MAG: PaaI family thioesterase [Marinifilaceae bacterium]
MKQLKNPYAIDKNYNCFGCSPHNDKGLKLEFYEEEEWIVSSWTPESDFQGYYNVLHGGIQATLLDEIACWAVNVQAKSAGVTTALNIKYRSTVFVNAGPIKIRAKVIERKRRLAKVHAELLTSDGQIGSDAEITYMCFPDSIAKDKLNWPGSDAFHE